MVEAKPQSGDASSGKALLCLSSHPTLGEGGGEGLVWDLDLVVW